MKHTKKELSRWRSALPCLGVAISLPGMPRLPAWMATISRWIFDPIPLRIFAQRFLLDLPSFVVVGAAGFEPTAFCAQGRRATRLRYTPSKVRLLYQNQRSLRIRWFELPRNCNEISFNPSTNGPSTNTSIIESISSVIAVHHLDSPSRNSSMTHPVYTQSVFPSPNFSRNRRRNGTSTNWFSGSIGSPPRIVSPEMKDCSNSFSMPSSISRVNGSP